MKGKRLKGLSGTVLIMVLTVMLVLIIMLMATLTVVSTASQRIYTKYEENQAYYSARSALDVFTQNMLYDKVYYAYTDGGSIKTFSHGNGDSADMKQGLAMQLDLYKIKTKGTTDADVPKSLENLLQSEFKDYIDSGVTGKDEYENNFGVVKNVDGTYESVITYEVEYPKVSGQETTGASHDYGALADNRKAKITVEVLSREYDMGDDVLTSDSTTKVKDKIASFNGDQVQIAAFLGTAQNYKDTIKAVANGSRKKDKIKLKITASAKVMGVEGTAVLICNSNEPPVNNSSRAITAFGGTGSDNMSILGGMSAENTINWGSNDGFIYGPVYVEDDFLMASNGPKIYLGSGENLVVGGDLQIQNDHFRVNNTTTPILVDDTKAPFVYIGGELRTGGGLNSSPFMNVDVVAKEVNIGGKIEFDSSCTIYCTKLTCKSGSNSTYNGDIYVDGDVIIYSDNDTKITYSGDPPAPTVVHGGSGTIHFTGDILDGNKSNQIVTSGATTGFVKETANFWSNIPEVSKITDNNPTTSEADDGTKIEFQLPGRTNKKEIETHVQTFDNYYVKDADGKRHMIMVTDPVSGASITTPEVKSAQTMAAIDTMTDKTKPFTSDETGITDKLSVKAPTGGSYYGTNFGHVLDTGGGNVKCIWDVDNKNIYIKGGGTVTLLLDETKSWGYSNDNMILVNDDTTLKIVGDVDSIGSGPYANTFSKIKVYNQTTYGTYTKQDAGAGVNPLNVGNVAGVGIKVPKIYYYFTGSKFSVQNDCLLTGYIYAPDTMINLPTASQNKPDPLSDGKGLKYNGTDVTDPNVKVCIIGSALVKGADIKNNQGVAYINPDLDDDGDAGDPIHQWQASLYTRN